jgi:hypothetical protein
MNTWNLYVAGYFQAAQALLEGPPDKFFLTFPIYPVIYLCHHYLELELKGLMIATARLLNKPRPEFEDDHNLLRLFWQKRSWLRCHALGDNSGRDRGVRK